MNEIKTILRSDYPDTLKNMKSPPRQLLFRGSFPAPKGHKYLCVVGSRKWTPYGRDAVHRIVSGLRGYPISIVSGLAIGIDSIAHIAALEAGLHCIAFPGSTLDWDKIYPSSHTNLARMIVDYGGALVSQWDKDYPTGTWAFPARNALMAGISHATLIVEAAQRSGSLMTAKNAELYSRDVYAVPGPIHAANSYGPHMLIRKGAVLVTEAADVLEELGFDVPRNSKRVHAEKIRSMDELSRNIMDVLSREDLDLDQLFEKVGGSLSQINEKISLLELEGLVGVDAGVVRVL